MFNLAPSTRIRMQDIIQLNVLWYCNICCDLQNPIPSDMEIFECKYIAQICDEQWARSEFPGYF